MSALTVSNEREINPMQLSLEQLNSLKQQHEEEVQELSSQLEQLHGAKTRFSNALAAIDDVSKSKDGDAILVPLNSSLYVPGKIVEPEKVIVELGTGYFCEKTAPAAKDLLNRKITLVAKSIESVESVAIQKRRNLGQLVEIIQYKIAQLQKGGGGGGGGRQA